ncbi:MAG: hypothetical protein K2Q01_09115, partial [Rickettsiales bacterium]|nr:hypothetical protein [Rickettsiales bacterium]
GESWFVENRLKYLDEAKAGRVAVFCAKPSEALLARAPGLHQRLPQASDIAAATMVLLAGLGREDSERIHALAKAAGKLINVEDVSDLCDFYFTANVRRGDLVIGVSTSGASPTLARKVRDLLACCFGEEWAGRVRELSDLRLSLRSKGAGMKETMQASEAMLEEKGWLNKPCMIATKDAA